MARRRRKAALRLSAEESRQALIVLVQEGRIAAAEVRRALERRRRLIASLRASLAALGEDARALTAGAARRASPLLRNVAKAAAPVVGRAIRDVKRAAKRAKPRISAATRRMYRRQGKYMAAVRQLPAAARVKIKRIREKSGVDAAIAAAKKMASRQ